MRKFTDIFSDETKYGCKIPTSEYLENGLYPIIDQGKKFISGYRDNEEGIYKNVPAIIFGDHTRILKYIDVPFFIGADGVKILKPRNDKYNYKYLFYALKNIDIPDTGYNRHFKWLKEATINTPDLQTQEYIVDILDRVYDLIQLRNQQLSKLDQLVKARFVEMFGDPIRNEKEWPVFKAKDICNKITDGTHDTPERFDDGYLLITGKNIREFEFDMSNVEFVSEEDHIEIYKRCNPEYGDVLYTNIGVNYGTALFNNLTCEFSMKNVALLKPMPNLIHGRFLWCYLNIMRNHILEMNKCGGAQTFMGLATIGKIKIMLPPFALQREFADFVQKVDKTKTTVKQSLEKLETLKKSLMQEYFG